jgi:hypothetical protein
VTSRKTLVERLPASCRVDPSDGSKFIAGARIRLKRGLSRAAAEEVATELRALGAMVELVADAAEDDALVGLDSLSDVGGPVDDAPAADAAATVDALRETLKAALGGDKRSSSSPSVHSQPSLPAQPPPRHSSPSLPTQSPPRSSSPSSAPPEVARVSVSDIRISKQMKSVAPPPDDAAAGNAASPSTTAPAAPSASEAAPSRRARGDEDSARFRPPPTAQAAIALDAAAPQPAPPAPDAAAPSTSDDVTDAFPDDEPTAPASRAADAPRPADDDKPIPGRLFRGALRRKPAVRIGAGLALGLLVGYLASAPYAGRSERRVAALRAQANADRYRPVEEARANARQLDAEADSQSTRAAVNTIAIWLLCAAAVSAAWYRAT